jgi:hypothetical protein
MMKARICRHGHRLNKKSNHLLYLTQQASEGEKWTCARASQPIRRCQRRYHTILLLTLPHHSILILHPNPLLLSWLFHHLLTSEACVKPTSLKLSGDEIFIENKHSARTFQATNQEEQYRNQALQALSHIFMGRRPRPRSNLSP